MGEPWMAKLDWKPPDQWTEWSIWLAAGLHARNRWRLPVLMMGMLFANGRRTVTSWLRAAEITDDFDDYYYFLAALGRKGHNLLRSHRELRRCGIVLDVTSGGVRREPFVNVAFREPGALGECCARRRADLS